ncbi:MAG: hypothetical protein LBL56_03950, partial [Treponema sp.]|nr:hypothetical protein [Treponema sp.]
FAKNLQLKNGMGYGEMLKFARSANFQGQMAIAGPAWMPARIGCKVFCFAKNLQLKNGMDAIFVQRKG